MSETTEEQNSESFDINRTLDIVRRRHFHFLIPMLAVWLLVWGASWLIPPRYKSSTLILVQEPTMPADYVAPNVSGNLQDRLQSISQQILSRTRLLMIVDSLHLYDADKTAVSDDDKVDRMRKDINIELVRDSRNNEISAFRVSFTARDPHMAQQVTSQLTDLFIKENLRVRQQESQGTTEFIQSQLKEAQAELSKQEAQVSAFEMQHQGNLPTQQASNLQILSGLQSQLQGEQDALNSAKEHGAYLQALIQQGHPVGGAKHSSDPAVLAIDQQLTTLRTQLADLSSRYTDQYPDVLRTKQQIKDLQDQRAQIIASGKPSESVDDTAGDTGSAIAQLQGQLHSNQLEVANRERSIAELQGRIGEYQGRLNTEPGTEQQLAELNRGYDQSKANYDDLLKKKNESEMATSMEQMQQGERFGILDPPSLPARPDFPNRLKFFGIGLVLGMVAGALVAGVTEFLDDRLHDEEEIKALLPIPIIGEIPQVTLLVDEQRIRRQATMKWAVTGFAIVILLVGAAFSYLHA